MGRYQVGVVRNHLAYTALHNSDNWILEESVPGITPPEGMDENSARRWISNQSKKALEEADAKRRLEEARAAMDALDPGE